MISAANRSAAASAVNVACAGSMTPSAIDCTNHAKMYVDGTIPMIVASA
jgi:hypothetical protein